jgi:hypothetical protein
MLLIWNIRYLDTADREFKSRWLILDTESLDVAQKAAVELARSGTGTEGNRQILKHRHLFRECSSSDWEEAWPKYKGRVSNFSVTDYFEDEGGSELTPNRMAVTITGNPNAKAFPGNMPRHYVEYACGPSIPIPLHSLSISAESLKVLELFSRDLNEMIASAYYRNLGRTLTISAGAVPRLQTQATEDELRSFMTIFRRLYMSKEPANFLKTCRTYTELLSSHPISNLVTGIAKDYENKLNSTPSPFSRVGDYQPNGKRIIDVFLYTRFAHQPNDERTKQYEKCLQATGGSKEVLMMLFLTVLNECSDYIYNAGIVIRDLYTRYCDLHKVNTQAKAFGDDFSGLGQLEKDSDKRARLRSERIREIAMQMWQDTGQPIGGHDQFIVAAEKQLSAAGG